jgi:hypothetical protein
LIKVEKDGSSSIDFAANLNVLVIGGSLDGLNRVTRLAESYYHTDKHAKQAGKITTLLIQGANHA